MHKPWLAVLVLTCCFRLQAQSALPKANPGADKSNTAALASALDELSARDEFSGAVLVAREGRPIFERAYGLASKEYGVANTIETRFNLGSINKVFTAVAIAQLAEQGKLGIDDPIGKYLPSYPNADARVKVTVRECLLHSSGIGDFFGKRFEEMPKDRFRTLSDYLPTFAEQPLAFAPGTSRRYSNGGYIVLGLIVEKASGLDYFDYVRKNIFALAGMNDTDWYQSDVPTPRVAMGYMRAVQLEGDPPGLRRANFFTRPAIGSSAGGGYSTLEDLLKFALAVASGKLRLPEFGPQAPARGPLPFHTDVGAAGGAPGINAVLESELPGGYTIVVLSNYDPPTAERAAEKIKQLLGIRED